MPSGVQQRPDQPGLVVLARGDRPLGAALLLEQWAPRQMHGCCERAQRAAGAAAGSGRHEFVEARHVHPDPVADQRVTAAAAGGDR